MPRPVMPDTVPRLLSREQAAAYVGLSPNQFEIEVRAGTFPQAYPLKKTRRRLFDKAAIDRALDALNPVKVDDARGWDEQRREWQRRQNKDRSADAGGRNGP